MTTATEKAYQDAVRLAQQGKPLGPMHNTPTPIRNAAVTGHADGKK